MICPAMRHGTATAYQVDGCRCPDAKLAQHRYRKQLRHRHHRGDATTVSAIGIKRRLQALQVMGWPRPEIMRRLGVSDHGTWLTVVDNVRPQTLDRVRAVYDELWDKPGPSAWTRSWALNRGYLPPMAWDDVLIDDPSCQPFTNVENATAVEGDDVAIDRFIAGDLDWKALTPQERIAAAVEMDRRGYTRKVIAERVHMRFSTLYAAFRDAGSVAPASDTADMSEAS